MRKGLNRTALRRGLTKRCPHCGQGRLFHERTHLPHCDVCGLVYERNPGDTWAFTILGDRLPLGIMVAFVYFTFGRSYPALGIAVFVVLLIALIWTAPNRWGAGIALHYLSRVYWPEPADPIPSTMPPAVTTKDTEDTKKTKEKS
jgi:uncharacterized protein (DUF983 family)